MPLFGRGRAWLSGEMYDLQPRGPSFEPKSIP